jgi:hypothetical protein
MRATSALMPTLGSTWKVLGSQRFHHESAGNAWESFEKILRRVAAHALAKDLTRMTADGIDAGEIQKIVPPPKGEKWGSLKSLENLVGLKVGSEEARSLVGPLIGIYQLRHADAHLAGSNLDDAFGLVGVSRTQPFVFQGYELLRSCVSSLYSILKAFRKPVSEAG